jgi:glucokinase
VNELLEAADTARARGAKVLAITASQSPLVKKADVALIVDYPEDVTTHLPMVSRILHLLVVDILAVGVAMRRHADEQPLPEGSTEGEPVEGEAEPVRASAAATASPAPLISHSR